MLQFQARTESDSNNRTAQRGGSRRGRAHIHRRFCLTREERKRRNKLSLTGSEHTCSTHTGYVVLLTCAMAVLDLQVLTPPVLSYCSLPTKHLGPRL
ncbi:hypothetical protein OJAV_G00089870 [Oryzias javanicus]|uniref:Uncharacterized protein n=1 Tax=Oryzias javanicus TaxID=123683 RepID=A0A3S2PRT4_ORYJA|nr:hypothetical protein OJAV_G00089870 [Oryzias javanicus]